VARWIASKVTCNGCLLRIEAETAATLLVSADAVIGDEAGGGEFAGHVLQIHTDV
jgi:hypothetical protein